MRAALRWALGGFLLFAGISHLTARRTEFRAQVPDWFPLDADLVVVLSGVIEIALGLALVVLGGRSTGGRDPDRIRVLVGWTVAAFFVAIFPGNIAQFVEGTDAFGLDTDAARFVRLLFQPVLVAWALYATAAWRDRRALRP